MFGSTHILTKVHRVASTIEKNTLLATSLTVTFFLVYSAWARDRLSKNLSNYFAYGSNNFSLWAMGLTAARVYTDRDRQLSSSGDIFVPVT